ncbi:hypothetical protein [Bacteroides cellulosilyticus]|uniref:hypothetical protein n=1 Tax=Bacteroides cellulosilyticus TaxID=246787 RepID=UPI0022DF902C|nr:hypothetical protein [Bacteroides cellulosilyticus]
MSPFGIFTIILIVVYIVYYAVIITRDLYGQKSSMKSEEEEFDVSSLRDEDETIGVEESENGFSLVNSKEHTGTSVEDTYSLSGGAVVASKLNATNGANVDNPYKAADKPAEPSGGTEMTGSTKDEGIGSGEDLPQRIDVVQEEMEDIDPIGNLTMSKELFREILLNANKEGSLFVKKNRIHTT